MLFKGSCFLVQIKSDILVDKTNMQSHAESQLKSYWCIKYNIQINLFYKKKITKILSILIKYIEQYF